MLVRTGVGADLRGVLRRVGEPGDQRDEIAQVDDAEQLGVGGAEVLSGSMTPLAAWSGSPDTSPLRADSAVSVMFGRAKPPLLFALNSTGGGSTDHCEHARVGVQPALQVRLVEADHHSGVLAGERGEAGTVTAAASSEGRNGVSTYGSGGGWPSTLVNSVVKYSDVVLRTVSPAAGSA